MVAIASIVIKLEYVKALIPTNVMWKPQEHIYFKEITSNPQGFLESKRVP